MSTRASATSGSNSRGIKQASDIIRVSNLPSDVFGPGCTGSVIETHHLSKLYSRGLYALQDLSLSVDKGEFVFLTGPSGAGKSTFLRLLLMQDTPSEGEIFVNGHNLSKLSRAARSRNTGAASGSSSRTSS